MLCNPLLDESSTLRIIGIDPGTTMLGVAVLEVDLRTNLIVSSHALTINADKLPSPAHTEETHGARAARIIGLQSALVRIFNDAKPSLVSCESPFMKRRMANAFAALTEMVLAVRLALNEHNSVLPLDLVDPPTAKMAVGATGKADKDQVLKAILSMKEIFNFTPTYNGPELKNVDEHSSDALAIAYWRYNKFING